MRELLNCCSTSFFPRQPGSRPAGIGAKRANGALFSPMDSKKRPSVPQRKQILAGGVFGSVKREPELEVRAAGIVGVRCLGAGSHAASFDS